MTTATRSYGGASADQRKARRRAALLAAGLELLGTKGWAGTTVRGVCALAGLNDRYFYESFADLDTLRLAVVDDLAAQGTAAILAATQAPRDLRARTRAVVTAVVDFFTADPRRAHILVHEFQASEPLRDRRRQLIQGLVVIFTAQVHEILGAAAAADEDVELTALTLIGGVLELVTTWLRGDLAVDRDHLIDFIVALMLAATARV
ncbi:MAG TPA: TetR/AcrR family transcriptional regulator [Streptosporangiaceae bacterium]